MNDVRFSDVQLAAAKWTQGVEAKGTDEAQSVLGARLDFEADNVKLTTARKGVVTANGVRTEIPEAKVLLDQTKAARLQQSVTSLHNDLLAARASNAEKEQNVAMLLELSEMAAAGEPKAQRSFIDAFAVTSLIAEVANKRQSTMAKIGAEMAKGQVEQLEKQKESILNEGPNIGVALASSLLSLAGGLAGATAKAEFFDKKGSAALKMISNITSQGANIVQLFERENEKGKSARTIESQKKLAIFKASMQGVMQLEQGAGDMASQICEAVKEINESSVKNQIHV